MNGFAKGAKILSSMLVMLVFLGGCGGAPPKEAKTAAPQGQEPKAPLFAYIGAGLKEPVTELAQMYEQKTGVRIEMTFNNSGALLNQLETAKRGDIYMPGGMPYVEMAEKNGHIAEMAGPIAYHVPVIATPKGNPAKISKIQDLARPGIKLIMPEKEATALGKTAFKIFDKIGIDKEVEKNIIAYVETAPKVPAMLLLGQGNAGIAEYSNISKNLDKLDLVEIDPALNMVEEIPCALLNYSSRKEQAGDFLEFVKKEGPAVFKKHGFKTVI